MSHGTIYRVDCSATGRSYIGQTIGPIERRFGQHLNPNSRCGILPRAVRKHGRAAFTVTPIETDVPIAELDQAERHWIDWYNTLAPHGYNAIRGGAGDVEASRARKSFAQRGRAACPALIAAVRRSNAERIVSEATREKHRALNVARGTRPPQARTGWKHSPEALERMTAARRARPVVRRFATCHTDAPHKARGLCEKCYQLARRAAI